MPNEEELDKTTGNGPMMYEINWFPIMRELMEENEVSEKYKKVKKVFQELQKAKEQVNAVLCAGVQVTHKKFGSGEIVENDGETLTLDFAEAGQRKIKTAFAVAKGLLSLEDEEKDADLAACREILEHDSGIRVQMERAEQEMDKRGLSKEETIAL